MGTYADNINKLANETKGRAASALARGDADAMTSLATELLRRERGGDLCTERICYKEDLISYVRSIERHLGAPGDPKEKMKCLYVDLMRVAEVLKGSLTEVQVVARNGKWDALVFHPPGENQTRTYRCDGFTSAWEAKEWLKGEVERSLPPLRNWECKTHLLYGVQEYSYYI